MELLTREEIEGIWSSLELDARFDAGASLVFSQAELLAEVRKVADATHETTLFGSWTAAFDWLLAEARKNLEAQK